jgi:lipoate-protein ligase A
VGKRVLHHGTLLFSADTGELAKALTVSGLKLKAKGVDSVKSRVTNIYEYLPEKMNVSEFKEYLFNYVFNHTKNAKLRRLTTSEWQEVTKKSFERHTQKDWIFGQEPDFDFVKEAAFPAGLTQAYIKLNNGSIAALKFTGDFFDNRNITELESLIIGTPYNTAALKARLKAANIGDYFYNTNLDQLINLLIGLEY